MKAKKEKKFKLKIKKGDTVLVIAGDDKGKQGRVIRVFPKLNKALVEGVNMVSKHQRPRAQNTQGEIVRKEAPIHISNLMLIDHKGQPTRVGRIVKEDGSIVRYSKKSKEEIK